MAEIGFEKNEDIGEYSTVDVGLDKTSTYLKSGLNGVLHEDTFTLSVSGIPLGEVASGSLGNINVKINAVEEPSDEEPSDEEPRNSGGNEGDDNDG